MAVNDGLGGPTPPPQPSLTSVQPSVIPPHIQSLHDAVSTVVDTSEQEVNNAIDAALTEIEQAYNQAESDVYLAVSSTIGQVDNYLTETEQQTHAHVDKVIDSTLQQILQTETDMSNVGVHIPIDTNQIAVDNQDTSGNSIMARLMGLPPVESPPAYFGPGEGLGTGYSPPASPPQPPPPYSGDTYPVAPVVPGVSTNDTLPVPTPIPPEPPPPPPPPAPVDTTVTQPCCCPQQPEDVNVTVTVPPLPAPQVTVNVQTSPTSPTPPPPPGPPPPPTPPPPPPTGPPPPPPLPPEPITEGGGGGQGGGAVPPPPPPDVVWTYSGMDWAAGQVCAAADTRLKDFASNLPPGVNAVDQIQNSNVLSSIYRGAYAATRVGIDAIFYDVSEQDRDAMFNAQLKLTGDRLGGYTAVVQSINAIDAINLPNKSEAWNLGLVLAQARSAEESSGFPLTYITTSLDYLFKYANPQFIPEQVELDRMLALGLMHQHRWQCLTNAHGNLATMRKEIVDSQIPQPTPAELATLKNRQAVEQSDYDLMMARAGFGDAKRKGWYESLSMFIPGPSDLVRFMVRDVFDKTVVDAYNLDKDFEVKFYGIGGKARPGPAAAWALAQGMTEDTFKFEWRAHWQLPSNTALYEMAHRLREDRPEVTAWNRRNPQWTPGNPMPDGDPRPPIVTIPDIQKAIEVNDMSPFWVQPLIEVAYQPITRTDAINAFILGSWDENKLYHAFRDNGFNDRDAKLMVDVEKQTKARRNRNQTGQWTERQILAHYRDGSITAAQADTYLTPLVPDPLQRNQYIQAADDEVAADRRRKRIKTLQRGYFVALYDYTYTFAELQKVGMSPRRANDLIDMWGEERSGRMKEPSAKMVLDWLARKIITPDVAFNRLQTIGYMDPDATRMVQGQMGKNADADAAAKKKQQKTVQDLIKANAKAAQETEKQKLARQKEIDKVMLALQKEKDKVANDIANFSLKVAKLKGTAPVSSPPQPGGSAPSGG